MSLVSIIIPTFNNAQYLESCVNSILLHQSTPGIYKIIIVNNGDEKSVKPCLNPEVKIIQAGKNLGWEGGLKEGLKYADTPFVVFMNDDTYIPFSSSAWLWRLLQNFEDPKVAAVGPVSNIVMGMQNIFIPGAIQKFDVNFLIGYCMMVRKDYLEQVGGIDDSYPNHGDDIDLSIRFKEAGFKLVADRSVFVYHHGFKTGQRLLGSKWNSIEMTERSNHRLIRKHGLKVFMKYISSCPPQNNGQDQLPQDSEGDICRKYANGSILELGCGGQKTVSGSEGIDIVPKGNIIPGLQGIFSIADITADITDPLPVPDNYCDTIIARHVLEHLIDGIKVLRQWSKAIKPGGRIIIAVPDHSQRNTIPMNYQHVHGYTPESLKTLMESLGWHTESIEDARNNVSFVGVFQKNGVHCEV